MVRGFRVVAPDTFTSSQTMTVTFTESYNWDAGAFGAVWVDSGTNGSFNGRDNVESFIPTLTLTNGSAGDSIDWYLMPYETTSATHSPNDVWLELTATVTITG